MARNSPRRFHIADAIILVAATAVGLGLTRGSMVLGAIQEKFINKYFPDGRLHPPEDGNLSDLGAFFLAPWSLCLVALRLWPRAPSRGRVLRRPGFVATGTATIFMIVRCAQFAIENARDHSGPFNDYWLVHSVSEPSPIAIAVLTSWTLMAAFGRWRPEPSWIDRVGRAVGFSWVAIALMIWFRWPIW